MPTYLAWHLATHADTDKGFPPPFRHQVIGVAGTLFNVEKQRVKIWNMVGDDPQALLKNFDTKLKNSPTIVTAFGTNFGIPVLNTNFAQHFILPLDGTHYFGKHYNNSDYYLHVDIAAVFSDFFANGSPIKFSDISTTLGLPERPKADIAKLWETAQHKKISALLTIDSAMVAICFLRLREFIREEAAPPNEGNHVMQKKIAAACAAEVKYAEKLFASLL
jgi:hypothetical protein